MKPKKKMPIIIAEIVMILSVVVAFYPAYAGWWSATTQLNEISTYKSTTETHEVSEQVVAAREFNKDFYNHTVEEYMQQLKADDTDVMAYVSIPSININLPIFHTVTQEVLKSGAGHMQNTSLPVGGVGTHAAISAHTGLPEARMFDNLHDVELGDLVYIEVFGETLAYKVISSEVVDPETGIATLDVDPNRDLISLITCTPYSVNTHRLVVTAERTELPEDYEQEIANSQSSPSLWWAYAMGGSILAILAVGYWALHTSPKSKV